MFLKIVGDKVERSMSCGIPLPQQWMHSSAVISHRPVTHIDAPLHDDSFTDTKIAMTHLTLSPEDHRRFEPMIIGFNPTEMYAADHLRRV